MSNITTRSGGSLAPTNMAEAMRFADMLAGSTMVPKDFINKPGNILVAIQWGFEVGLGPLQALQNIAVINGRPAIWGDAALALVRGHPACVSVREGVDGEGDDRTGWCEVTRRGEQPQRRTFGVKDAKKAGLWNKPGPWQQYPDRMLQLRARGFAIRDVFPDALRGVITAEEAQDMPETRVVPNMAPPAPGTQAAAMVQLQAPDEAGLPIISPDGALHEIKARGDQPAVTRWLSAARKAIGSIANDGRAALISWRAEMGPHLASISEQEPEAVAAVEALIESKLDAMTVEPEPIEEAEPA